MDIEEKEGEEKHHCRICYSEESVEEKGVPELKFLTPCNCKGNMSIYTFFMLTRLAQKQKATAKREYSLSSKLGKWE